MLRGRGRTPCAVAAMTALFALGAAAPARAADFHVDSLADTNLTGCDLNTAGDCTLRGAINNANGNGAGSTDNIFFAVSGTINVAATALPSVSTPTTIGVPFTPQVELNGAGVPGVANGLTVTANGSAVQGLAINRFSGDGIVVSVGDDVVVRNNRIGTDIAGSAALPNGRSGVRATGGADGLIVEDNLISGNTDDGISFFNSSDNAIVRRNTIGLAADAVLALPNGEEGIETEGGGHQLGQPGAGNVIAGNAGAGIRIAGALAPGNLVQGNTIGLNAGGGLAANGDSGVLISVADDTVVGAGAAGAANTISGNAGAGVEIEAGGTGNRILGNRIGTNSAGTRIRPNALEGVRINDSPANVVGGPGAGEGNVISGNLREGIEIDDTPSVNNVVQGNRIGTNAAGTLALPNEIGVRSEGAGNRIGGAGAGEGNVISGNTDSGIELVSGTTGILVQGNRIGTNAAGAGPVSNGNDGIEDNGGTNTVGGPGAASNTIAFNLDAGVAAQSDASLAIAENSIFSNEGLGIDLGTAGVTPNDPGDADQRVQNFPDLAAAVGLAGETVVAGTFAGAPGQALLLRFFANPDCDPSGHGEGRTFLGAVAVNPDGAGNAAFEAVLPPTAAGDRVTATASGPVGTSEFSACRTVEAGGAAAFAVADTAASEGARASLTVARSGSSALAASVRFATADGTARASGDYAPASGSLAFAPGQATQTIEVPVADDRAAEGDERFFVSLSDPTRVALGGPDTTTITIPGNDRGPDSNIVGLARSARAGALRRIAGTASDADGDLARVEVAIVGATGGARVAARRCLDITAAGRVRGRAAPRSGRCAPRTFLRATGRTRWTLRLRRALPRGRWVVFSRAVDRAGRRERSFTTRDRNRAAVRVR